MVDGDILVRDFALTQQDVAPVTADARKAAAQLAARAGI